MKNWLSQLLEEGLVPYVATSEAYLDFLDLSLFEGKAAIKLLENPDHCNFHEAYLVSNSFAFGNPNLKMPNWVYIDCVLMQTAVVGFALPVKQAPPALLDFFEKDPWVDARKLDYIPVTGQIASMGINKKTLIGFSLFSLRRQIGHMNVHKLAHKTKYAALSVYRAEEAEKFMGVSQYDNKALLTHSLFGKKMYIEQTMAPVHPLKDMSFVYSMKVDLNQDRILGDMSTSDSEYDFLLKADDKEKKIEMQKRIYQGEKFHIVNPIHIIKDDGLYLPVKIEK